MSFIVCTDQHITAKQIFLFGTFICVLTCWCMFMYMDVNLLEVTKKMLTNQYNYEQNDKILTKSPNIEPGNDNIPKAPFSSQVYLITGS